MVSDSIMKSISLVGLGKLGLPYAACFADAGWQVTGVDTNEALIDAVNQGRAPFFEPGLDELLLKHGGNTLWVTQDMAEVVTESDLTIILVPTPSVADGHFTNRHVRDVLEQLGNALRDSDKPWHNIVVSCTVMPGSTEEEFIPLLETLTGRRCGEGFGICYNPDFVALGDVINGFRNPEIVIIGAGSQRSGEELAELYRRFTFNDPEILIMSPINAEIAKLTLNAFITSKISFSNLLARLCEQIPGADVDAVTSAVGCDRRVGASYFRGGLAYAGTCFPRDTYAYVHMARGIGEDTTFMEAVQQQNHAQNRHLSHSVRQIIRHQQDSHVGILGLAFKPDTPVLEESPAIKCLDDLLQVGTPVTVFDEHTEAEVKVLYGEKIYYAQSANECLSACTTAVLTYRCPNLKAEIESFQPAKPLSIVDPWRFLDPAKLAKEITWVPLGVYRHDHR